MPVSVEDDSADMEIHLRDEKPFCKGVIKVGILSCAEKANAMGSSISVTEHFGVPIHDVDMVMASLENALASTGGFCVGRSYVVSHQRLSGLGYCFSASLPPLLATATNEGLRIISEEPDRVTRVQRFAVVIHRGLSAAFEGTNFILQGVELSPMKHIMYDGEEAEKKLDLLVAKLFDEAAIMITRARYLEHEEMFPVLPSVRLMVQSEMTEHEIEHALTAIAKAVAEL